MKLSLMKLAVLSFVLFLIGCGGRNFVRVQDDALVLNQTTKEQITSRLGKPFRESVVKKNDLQVEVVIYAYSSYGGVPDASDAIPERGQAFYFFNGNLVGYEFASSWKQESTNFDAGKASQIKKGVTTRSDVVRLLGNPGGKYIYPVIPNENEEAVNYIYIRKRKAGSAEQLTTDTKSLVVTFDKQDILTNVELKELTSK